MFVGFIAVIMIASTVVTSDVMADKAKDKGQNQESVEWSWTEDKMELRPFCRDTLKLSNLLMS